MVSGLESKIYIVFWREKSCTVQQICPIKSQSIRLLSGQTLLKSVDFVFFLAALRSQKIVKEIAYIPTSFQAQFKNAFFFLSFVKRKTKEK